MTVSTTSNIITYAADGADTTWPFTFAIIDEDDIVVTVTDSDGDVTTIPSADYTVVVNAAVAPNPTPVGGMVTYPTSGPALALGNSITIERVLDLTQPTSLSNQGTLYQEVIEQALDRIVLEIQQVNTENNQAIRFAISDDEHTRLPGADQIASKLLGFDSSGNPIAVELVDAGSAIVSSAMIPVIEAATLALARTALGLGNIAVEDIGPGLEDDGAGNLRVNSDITADAGNTAVTSAFHETQRSAVAALTYTLPKADTLWNGFCFYVTNTGGLVTFAPNAADSFGNLASGTSYIAQPNSFIKISTDGVATWFMEVHYLGNVGAGGAILNGYLTQAQAAGAMTISIKALSGNSPSSMEPVYIAFRSATAGTGTVAVRLVQGALAITVPSTALLGTTLNIPFRLWITLFDNAGTLILGVVNCLSGTDIFPLQGWGIASPTAISTGADSAHVMYAASAPGARAYVPIGYMTWETGLAVAGVWDAAPTRIQLTGYGVPLPGTPIQTARTTTGATSTTTTNIPYDDTIPQIGEGTEFMSKAIIPSSAANILTAEWQFNGSSEASTQLTTALFAAGAANAVAAASRNTGNVSDIVTGAYAGLASVTTSITFSLRAGPNNGATTRFNGAAGARLFGGVYCSFINLRELMA